MSLGLVSEFPREDTSGLSVWAHPTSSSHLQEGGRGQRSLTDLRGSKQSVLNAHTCCAPLQSRRHRKGEGSYPVLGPELSPGLGGWDKIPGFSVRRVTPTIPPPAYPLS